MAICTRVHAKCATFQATASDIRLQAMKNTTSRITEKPVSTADRLVACSLQSAKADAPTDPTDGGNNGTWLHDDD